MSSRFSQLQSANLQRFRFMDRAAATKPNRQTILCSSGFGTTNLEVGYAPENVVLTVEPESCPFMCKVCKGLPRYPVEIKKCGHLFCSFCIFRVLRERSLHCFTLMTAACPICKKNFSSPDVLEIAKTSLCLYNLYLAIDVRCTYGCAHICSPKAMLEHETWQCRRRPVKCPNSGCNYETPDEDMEHHLDVCPSRLVYCSICRLPKRASESHECIGALRATIQLLIGDRIAIEFTIDKIFGEPLATHYGSATDIGTHRLNDEAEGTAHSAPQQDNGFQEDDMEDAVNDEHSQAAVDEVDWGIRSVSKTKS